MMRIAVLVQGIEGAPNALPVRRFELLERDRHLQGEFLADVAQIEKDLLLGAVLVPQPAGRLAHHFAVSLNQGRKIDPGQIAVERADEIVALVGHQHAERREMRREKRHDHLRNVQLARDRDGMQRTGAARRDEHEIARIVAFFDRDLAHGERHLGDGDLDDRRAAAVSPIFSGLAIFSLDAARRASPGRASSRRRESCRGRSGRARRWRR